MEGRIEILVADDHPIFRSGLVHLLRAAEGFSVVGEAGDGEEALARIREARPHVAVLDVDMPRRDGLGVAQAVAGERLPVGLFLTMHKSERLLNAALDLGVKGFVLKDSAASDVVAAVRAVAGGEEFISPSLSKYLVSRVRRAGGRHGLEGLTPTELRVLRLVARGKTSKEIAAELFVSVRTIEHHREHIADKLDLSGSDALLTYALEHKDEIL